jgi:iron complex outermembrane receptor protein
MPINVYIVLSVSALALVASPAAADPAIAEPETIIVLDRAPDPDAAPAARDRDRALGDAPFITIIHPDDHPATASVADAVGATVGAQTRSLGGLGAFASVSVRGASPGHTVVSIDGVPLARLAAVTTDLGRFALDAFGEVELYRGGVPVELGGAGVGGALNLVTRLGRGVNGERVRASIGVGSFGARHLRLHYGDAHADGRVLSSTTIGYQGATGDYSYFYDGGTPLNANDDGYQIRRNNGFDQVDAATRVGAADRGAAGGLRLAYKHQGLPGSTAAPATIASLGTFDAIADGRFEARAGAATTRELGYVLVERQRLRDPIGELGLGAQDRGYLTLSGGATSTWIVPLGLHRATAGGELRADRFTDADRSGARGDLIGTRVGGAALASVDVVLDPARSIVITPSFRIDAVRTAPTPMTTGPNALVPIATRRDVVPSPRVTARANVVDDVAVKGSAGWYVRLPTLLELFGDRGAILGSPDLLPERGPSGDFGVVWAPARALGDVDRVIVEADAFATRAHDTIAFITSAGFVSRALNIADSQTYGGELVMSGRVARTVSVTANYTRLVTEQIAADVSYDGKALPRQPGHVVYARADVARRAFDRRASVWLDGSWQSETYLDRANLQRVPARALAGTGARIELVAGIAIAIAIENLADVRIEQLPLMPPPRPDLTHTPTALADVGGFPLPGRSFYLSLDWSH